MFERFTEKSIKVLVLAQEEARRLDHSIVGPEQILLGLLGEGTSIAAKVLRTLGANLREARVQAEIIFVRGPGGSYVEIPFAQSVEKIWNRAWEESQSLGTKYIAPEHLLLGLLHEPEAEAMRMLQALGIDQAVIKPKVLSMLKEQTLTRKTGSDEDLERAQTSPHVFEQLTTKGTKVIALAQEEARRLGHNSVGTEQLLLGMIGEGSGVAAQVVKSLGVNLKDARVEVQKIIGRGSGFVAVEIPYTPRAKRMLELSWDEARQLDHNYIGPEHLLLGLVREGGGVAARVLENLGVNLPEVRQRVLKLLAVQDPEIVVDPNTHTADDTTGNSPGNRAPDKTFERFTKKSLKAIMFAQEEARRLGHNFVGTEMFLLGLIGEGTGIAAQALRSMGANLNDARVEVEKIMKRGSGFVAQEIPYTPRAKRLLEISWDEARNLGSNYIGTEHLLLALVREADGENESVAHRVLKNLGFDLDKIRENVIRLVGEALTEAPQTSRSKQVWDNPYAVCPDCAESIRRNAITCPRCGYGLSDRHFVECQFCKERIRKGAIKCRHCHSMIKEN